MFQYSVSYDSDFGQLCFLKETVDIVTREDYFNSVTLKSGKTYLVDNVVMIDDMKAIYLTEKTSSEEDIKKKIIEYMSKWHNTRIQQSQEVLNLISKGVE